MNRRSKLISITPEEHSHFIRFIKSNDLTQRIVETYFKLPQGTFPNWRHSGIFQDQETKDRFLRLIDMDNTNEETMKDYNEILRLRDNAVVNNNENRSGDTLILNDSDVEGMRRLLEKYDYYSRIPKEYGISISTYKSIIEGKREFRQYIVEKLRKALEKEFGENSEIDDSTENKIRRRSALLKITPEEHEHFISFLNQNSLSVTCFERYFNIPVHTISNWKKMCIFTPEQKEIFLRAINVEDYPSFKEDVEKMKELQKTIDDTRFTNRRGSSSTLSDEDYEALKEVVKKYGKGSLIPNEYGISSITYNRLLADRNRRIRGTVIERLHKMFSEELGEDYSNKTQERIGSHIEENPQKDSSLSSIWRPRSFREAVLTLKTKIEEGYSDNELKDLMKEIVEGF